MAPELTVEQRQALNDRHGVVQGSSFVIMSIDLYREMMGLGCDDDVRESVAALQAGMAEAKAGKTHLFTEILDNLGRKYEDVPS